MGSGITIEGQIPNDRRIIGITVRGLPTATLLQIQWNDTDKVFEFVAAAGGSLGDLGFLSKKQFDGDLLQVAGAFTVVNDAITIVPANLKTFYLSGGHAVLTELAAAPTLLQLQNNSVLKEDSSSESSGVASKSVNNWDIQLKGDSLEGDGILIYRMILTADNGNAIGNFFGFIADTGTDPTA